MSFILKNLWFIFICLPLWFILICPLLSLNIFYYYRHRACTFSCLKYNSLVRPRFLTLLICIKMRSLFVTKTIMVSRKKIIFISHPLEAEFQASLQSLWAFFSHKLVWVGYWDREIEMTSSLLRKCAPLLFLGLPLRHDPTPSIIISYDYRINYNYYDYVVLSGGLVDIIII